jgi:group I intron endonuclease
MLIYLVKNRITGKEYVGQTVRSLNERWSEHCRPSKIKKCTALHNAIAKYGRDAFVISLLDETDDLDELNKLEAHHIASRRTLVPVGYNLTTGGNGYVQSEVSKRRRSQTLMGHRHTTASKQKMSFARKGKLSPKQAEHLRHIHEAAVGRKHTPEWRAATSQRMMGNQNGRK